MTGIPLWRNGFFFPSGKYRRNQSAGEIKEKKLSNNKTHKKKINKIQHSLEMPVSLSLSLSYYIHTRVLMGQSLDTHVALLPSAWTSQSRAASF